MRKTLSFALFSIALLSAVGARAQNPNYNVGPVWRVTYIHLKPAQGNAFFGTTCASTSNLLGMKRRNRA